MENNDFDGVFRFTNASKEDFKVMWNSKEYTFPAESTCPLIIQGESLENIQEIRKKFAKKYAQREFEKSAEGKKIAKEGSKHVSPATYDEAILNPWIQQCLDPLPLAAAKVAVVPIKKPEFIDGGTAILGEGGSLNSLTSKDGEFKDYIPPVLGQMQG